MPPTRPPYPSELKRQIIELVRAGRPTYGHRTSVDAYIIQ